MDRAADVLFQHGVAGVVILGLTWAVRVLYVENQRLNNVIIDITEARRKDAVEVVDKIVQPLDGITKTLNLVYDGLIVKKSGRAR